MLFEVEGVCFWLFLSSFRCRWGYPVVPISDICVFSYVSFSLFFTYYLSFSHLIPSQVCAPTGAGKTNVAMLTLLQLINMHRDSRTGVIDKAAIKAVYIAPMKALAQEVVTKFAERLSPLGLVVKEVCLTFCRLYRTL